MRIKKSYEVLVVEDVEPSRDSIVDAFQVDAKEFTYNVSAAGSVEEYLDKHERSVYDVYVIDLQLDDFPESDMWTATETYAGNLIVEIAATEKREPVVAVYSAHKADSDKIAAVRLGAHLYITKSTPDSAGYLVRCVEQELIARMRLADTQQEVIAYLNAHPEVAESHEGMFIALVGDEILVSEPTRLRAFHEYRRIVRERPNELPAYPSVVEVL